MVSGNFVISRGVFAAADEAEGYGGSSEVEDRGETFETESVKQQGLEELLKFIRDARIASFMPSLSNLFLWG